MVIDITESAFLDLIKNFVIERLESRKNGYLSERYQLLEKELLKLETNSWLDRLQDRLEWDIVLNKDINDSIKELSLYYKEKLAKK